MFVSNPSKFGTYSQINKSFQFLKFYHTELLLILGTAPHLCISATFSSMCQEFPLETEVEMKDLPVK